MSLVTDWTPLARGMARRAVTRMPWLASWREDLEQEAFAALVRCERGFEGRNGASFGTYARRAIATAIWRAARSLTATACGYGHERDCRDRVDIEEREWLTLATDESPDRATWAHDARLVRSMLIARRKLAGSPTAERDVDAFLATELGDESMAEVGRRNGVRPQTVDQQNRKVRAALDELSVELREAA